MKALKKYAKYILIVVGIYLLTSFLIFIGFNSNYKKIELKNELPEQISIEKAEASKKEGRIYGYVKNMEESNLNGKYIKVSIYNSGNENIATEYLKIDDLKSSQDKLFKATFVADNAKSYEINIVDNK